MIFVCSTTACDHINVHLSSMKNQDGHWGYC